VIVSADQRLVAKEMYVALELVFDVAQTETFVPADGKTVETYLAT